MGQNNLDYIFKPRAIAVLGAGRDYSSFGHRVVKYLVDGGFQGPVYPVNPKAKVVHSFPCYARIEDVPKPVDLAVISIPANLVPSAVENCAAHGVKGVIVNSAGFREVGPKGEALEKKLTKVVRDNGMRMIGPNCMGVINTDPETRMNATFSPAPMGPGGLAFMSQSGAMGAAILNYAREMSLGLSMYVSVGNRSDVSVNDLLEKWKDDPKTEAILLYMESFGNPRRFTQIARTITPKKPIIAVKAGRTASGIMAADLHTGEGPSYWEEKSNDATVDALFSQCGVIRVETLEEMFDFARAVISQPLPKGPRVAVLTNGGGPGIMAADALEGMDLDVPPLDPRTISGLEENLLAFASTRNPVDLRADAVSESYSISIPLVLSDPNIDVLLIIYIGVDYSEIADEIIEKTKGSEKPVFVCMMGGDRNDPGITKLIKNSIPVYSFPESACKVVRRMCEYQVEKNRSRGKIKKYKSVDSEKVARIFKKLRKENRLDINPDEMREIAESYGAKAPKGFLVHSEKEAIAAAQEINMPMAVKIFSSQIRKKSDVGGVALDLRTVNEVRDAYISVQESVLQRYPSAKIEGVIVQQMLKGGQEMVLGAYHDPIFGPVLKIGSGGPYADIVRDLQFRIVPITHSEAFEMIKSLKIYPLLEGTRGRRPVHIPSLVDLLCRLSQLIDEFVEIRELEINPLIVYHRKKEIYAVDGKLKLFDPDEMKKLRLKK